MFGSCPGEEDYPDVCKVEEGPRREGSRAERRREGYRSRTQEESVETGPRREGCRSRTQEVEAGTRREGCRSRTQEGGV